MTFILPTIRDACHVMANNDVLACHKLRFTVSRQVMTSHAKRAKCWQNAWHDMSLHANNDVLAYQDARVNVSRQVMTCILLACGSPSLALP
ncbi:hypothetical protein DVH24_017546 [Malus domestica]|uniref:Uncharacterized protein n=1 Tax=Malus domestica TaxID=3750 RepID=A0A498KGH9_MALDO|nr:hypothetical protein DVH24_017546 [Malus domestica]